MLVRPVQADAHSDEAQLLSLLNEMTELATKTRMNQDYVPGVVSVLHGHQLERQGVATVFEALGRIPGVEIAGYDTVSFRNLKIWGSGKHKVMLDGMALDDAVQADASPPLMLPIEMVDRIEVIRGPGSATHGEYAFAGVINIITRKQIRRGWVQFDSFDGKGVGGQWSEKTGAIDWQMHLHYNDSPGQDLQVGEDILYSMGLGALSNAPGSAPNSYRNRSLIVQGEMADWSLQGFFLEARWSAGGGITSVLPPADTGHVYVEQNSGLQLSYRGHLQGDWDLQAAVGWRGYGVLQNREPFYPAGVVNTGGMTMSSHVQENRYDLSADLIYKGFSDHTLLMGAAASRLKLQDVWSAGDYDPTTFATIPWQRFSPDSAWMGQGVSRTILSLYGQDQWTIHDKLSMNVGLRFDRYSDLKDALTPRVALVYRQSGQRIYKAQYAQAFRPPTFLEKSLQGPGLAGNPDVRPETMRSVELSHIRKAVDNTLSLNLFYSEYNDLIEFANGTYDNSRDAISYGVEVEYNWQPTAKTSLHAGFTAMRLLDEEDHEPFALTTDLLGFLHLSHQLTPSLQLFGTLRATGPYHRSKTDSRPELDPQLIFNTGGDWQLPKMQDLSLGWKVTNLFNSNLRTPTATASAYSEDFPTHLRAIWLKLSYRFQ
uniref:Putative TonB-dependent receptor n=1 Tax=Magnetococcus massalia (strain MO-1) TaxID=451514 RepID=A0A1S7LJE5_MAGMO|nr:putative TonB-dependent receptor [Candidatus Magnetococcus massalia]